jgi:secreted trypsin-like serine protease
LGIFVVLAIFESGFCARRGGRQKIEFGTNLYAVHPNLKYFNLENCGKSTWTPYPWMVLIVHKDTVSNKEYACGGSLVNSNLIVTAARCATRRPGTVISVEIGKDLEVDNSRHVFTESEIEIIIHPEYKQKENRYFNDIAVIKLNQEVVIDFEVVSAICLPFYEKQKSSTPEVLEITGWGETNTEKVARNLQVGNVPNLSLDECKTFIKVSSKQICTFSKDIGTGPCTGDEGDPLQYEEANSRYYLYGVTSFWDEPCGKSPAVYTRVSEFMNFIMDNAVPLNSQGTIDNNQI